MTRPPCMCDFELDRGCDGDGFLKCSGCGGDSCVCAACFGHGELECEGCDYCGDADAGVDEVDHGLA